MGNGTVRHADRRLAQKNEGERNNFGYLRLRTEDNIKMAFQDRRCKNLDSILLAQEGVRG